MLGNASTRFADSFRYDFDAEVGINIRQIHARGPVGLEGVVIYRHVLKIHDESHIVGEFGQAGEETIHASVNRGEGAPFLLPF